MAGEQPAPFITVPHGFHYHYSDNPPKTPERELAADHVAERPPSARGFRVKRRSRPRINTSISSQTSEIMAGLQDTPLPSIEISDQQDHGCALRIDTSQPNERFLSPLQSRSFTVPRTPSEQRTSFGCDWTPSRPNVVGQSIERPLSAFSSLSDSSDDSLMSSEDGFSFGGSCTSPESDAPDPFIFPTPIKASSSTATLLPDAPAPTKTTCPTKPRWSKEMDNHIWAIYMNYLNDPTVTPFKTLPGIPPPVGVCHRVAREARRTWKGGKAALSQSGPMARVKQLRRDGSPDTVTERSGSSTPTSLATQRPALWAGSGSATRKRFRELCKRKATIAPHYQRMLQSRSPSPFLTNIQGGMRSTRAGSPFISRSPFATRDVAVSLSTSTASSMHPNAPLARLSTMQQSDEWFNDPEVPWASPPVIPSDIENSNEAPLNATSNLGSPFTGSHTWGPSNSRRHLRPSVAQFNSEDTSTIPRLRSPVHFASVPRGSCPSELAPRTPKRPAQSELEEVLSSNELKLRRGRFDDLFGGNLQSARRRLRARGMSLEDRSASSGVQGLAEFDDPRGSASAGPSTTSVRPSSSPMNIDHDPFLSTGNDSIKRLGSPFPGIGSRPIRARGRHVSSHSLSSYHPEELESIDQRLHQSSVMDHL